MSKVQSIREMRREGESVTAISKKLEVSRDTVYKYLNESESSPFSLTDLMPRLSGPPSRIFSRTRLG